MNTPIDTPALAAMLGVTARTIQRKARDREIPHLRVGRIIKFTPQHVEQIMQSYERAALERRPEAEIRNPLYQPYAVVMPMKRPAA